MADAVATSPESDDDAIRLLSGTQKCAILMLLLGEDEASEIMKNLSPREVQQLGSAMYSVADLDQRTVNLVLDEFLDIMKAQTSIGLGADAYIRRVLTKALGEDKAGSIITRIAPSSGSKSRFDFWISASSSGSFIVASNARR